jgi:hypothetical protein
MLLLNDFVMLRKDRLAAIVGGIQQRQLSYSEMLDFL